MADATTKRIKPEIKDRIIATASALVAEGIDNPTNDQIRVKDRDTQIADLKTEAKEAREDVRKLQAELVEIARNQ